MTNSSSLLQITKEVDGTGFTNGFFFIFAILGFFVVMMTQYEYKGLKEVFVMSSFVVANIIGLFFLSGLATPLHLIMGLVLVVISILVYYFSGD